MIVRLSTNLDAAAIFSIRIKGSGIGTVSALFHPHPYP